MNRKSFELKFCFLFVSIAFAFFLGLPLANLAYKSLQTGSGTGLGLSISKMILEKHGQRIELLDSEDGAAFRFTLQRVNGHEGSK